MQQYIIQSNIAGSVVVRYVAAYGPTKSEVEFTRRVQEALASTKDVAERRVKVLVELYPQLRFTVLPKP